MWGFLFGRDWGETVPFNTGPGPSKASPVGELCLAPLHTALHLVEFCSHKKVLFRNMTCRCIQWGTNWTVVRCRAVPGKIRASLPTANICSLTRGWRCVNLFLSEFIYQKMLTYRVFPQSKPCAAGSWPISDWYSCPPAYPRVLPAALWQAPEPELNLLKVFRKPTPVHSAPALHSENSHSNACLPTTLFL